jgi:L-glyceraldehyde 3-phosphate reductase
MSYSAAKDRYDSMPYNRCGQSGLLLPAFSLGFWRNFGDESSPESIRELALGAFDLGITHFDLANTARLRAPPSGI